MMASLDDQPEHVRDLAANVASRERPAPMAYRDGVTAQAAVFWRLQIARGAFTDHPDDLSSLEAA